MARILVTGASGFIGSALVRALAADGWSVRAASRNPARTDDPAIEPALLPDLAGPVEWAPLVTGVDAIVHLAGLAHAPRPLPDDLYDRINRQATASLAAAARHLGVRRLVFVSSIAAQIGLSALKIVTEDDPPAPVNAYGRSKLAAEEAVRASGVQFTVLRPVAVYGPGAKGNPALLHKLAALPLPLPFGACSAPRSMLALDNLIAAILFVLTKDAAVGETYLVADEEPLTLTQMLAALRHGQGRRPNLVRVPQSLLRFGLRLLGRESIWERIGAPLVVSSAKLAGAGWKSVIDPRSALSQAAHAAS